MLPKTEAERLGAFLAWLVTIGMTRTQSLGATDIKNIVQMYEGGQDE